MWNLLEEARQNGWLLRLKRDDVNSGESHYGFVAALSSDFVALSIVDANSQFDGASVFEIEDVSFLQWDTVPLRARARVLAESPTSPLPISDLELTSWESVIRSVAANHPLMCFHRDRADPDVSYIGTNIRVEAECVHADEVSYDGILCGHFALRLSDLTQIEFGDAYNEALWRMARNAQSSLER